MSVEFEPVKLGPRRGRVDPVAIAVLVVVAGLIAALLKPWDAGAGTGASASGGIAAATAAVPAGSGSLPGAPSAVGVASPPVVTESTAAATSWADVRPAVRPHDAWGIRAIVAEPSVVGAPGTGLRLAEHWDPIPFDSEVIPSVDVQPNDRTVVAIGITFPASHMPLDARIWLVHPDGLEWLDARPMDPSPSGGAFLYQLVGVGGAVENWAAGRYRVDVLVGGTVRWFGFTLPNRFLIVPDRPNLPITGLPAAGQDLIDPAGGVIPGLPMGLFATAVGASIPLASEEGPALDEADAWLNVDPGTGRAPRSYVASAFISWATGLGVILPPGSLVQESALRRLSPGPLAREPERVTAGALGSQISSVLYRAPDHGVWSPGVYQISVFWTDAQGPHDRSWHVELRPGPFRGPPGPLLAARAYARYAGATGVAVGTAEPLDGGPASETIRLVQPGPDHGTGFPVRDQVSCDGVRVEDSSGIVGVAYPVHAPPSKVTMRALYEFSRSQEQPILTARGDVPGLTLIAPVGDVAGISSAYRLRIGDATVPGATVCLGIAPVD